jgi:regulator of replication initiation timing
MLAGRLASSEQNMMTKADMKELQDQLDTLKKENQHLKEENITLKRELEASKSVAKSFSDASSENLAQKGKVVTYKEVKDRNDRRLNFIICGIRESEREDGLERREDDRKEAIRVCALTGVVEERDVQESIWYVCCLGKEDAEKSTGPFSLKSAGVT